ncbi:unnamed protein product [Rhizoctonia solani]|uniref:Uncharacterized protein n=1 Tax=Rhizoctonia solani TaxID=456999 RepID=A0A8H3CHN3_9AGAM|nr:unnamed protein product [Rhizoctonia solani]
MLEEGVYHITNYAGGSVFVLDGSPPGMPVECMKGPPPSAIHVRCLEGNMYSLTPGNFAGPGRLAIGFPMEGSPVVPVLLFEAGTEHECTEWYIDHNGENKYEIRAAKGPGNQYWTLTGDEQGPIVLVGSQGSEKQQWRLDRIFT